MLAIRLAVEILKTAEVSVIDPVFMLLFTLKSYTVIALAAPIVYKSSKVLLTSVSLVIVILEDDAKKKKTV